MSTEIEGPLIVEPSVHEDQRGFFLESWNERSFADAGLDLRFVQDNHSRSDRGVLRGLHFQDPDPQGKLVRVSAGRVWDVAVDIRSGSPSRGRWVGVELSGENRRMFWIPPGFAHGFLALEDGTDFLYKCTAFYDAAGDRAIRWDDPDIAIDWPLDGIVPRVSPRDAAAPSFAEVAAP